MRGCAFYLLLFVSRIVFASDFENYKSDFATVPLKSELSILLNEKQIPVEFSIDMTPVKKPAIKIKEEGAYAVDAYVYSNLRVNLKEELAESLVMIIRVGDQVLSKTKITQLSHLQASKDIIDNLSSNEELVFEFMLEKKHKIEMSSKEFFSLVIPSTFTYEMLVRKNMNNYAFPKVFIKQFFQYLNSKNYIQRAIIVHEAYRYIKKSPDYQNAETLFFEEFLLEAENKNSQVGLLLNNELFLRLFEKSLKQALSEPGQSQGVAEAMIRALENQSENINHLEEVYVRLVELDLPDLEFIDAAKFRTQILVQMYLTEKRKTVGRSMNLTQLDEIYRKIQSELHGGARFSWRRRAFEKKLSSYVLSLLRQKQLRRAGVPTVIDKGSKDLDLYRHVIELEQKEYERYLRRAKFVSAGNRALKRVQKRSCRQYFAY